MFKQLLIASAIATTIVASGVASAQSYKGDRDYKGEMAPACPSCAVYSFMSGPYLGLSVGIRGNYTGAPTVYKGVEGNIALGYAGVLSPAFYLAGEIFASDSWTIKNRAAPGVNGVKTTWNYGISILPGVMLTDYVMGYLRLGAVHSRFSNASVNRTGWQVGLGAQTNLAPCWDLRGEYVASFYNRITTVGRPRTDVTSIGVVWKFM